MITQKAEERITSSEVVNKIQLKNINFSGFFDFLIQQKGQRKYESLCHLEIQENELQNIMEEKFVGF